MGVVERSLLRDEECCDEEVVGLEYPPGRESGGLVEVEVVVVVAPANIHTIVRSINSCISGGFLLGWFAF